MFEILDYIVDWLGTEHGSGRRRPYGWQLVVMAAVGIAGMLKANEIRSNQISLKKGMHKKLSEGPLVATIFKDEAGQAIQTSVKVEKTIIGYLVVVERSAGPCIQPMELGSLEEVEAFLEEKTNFRLADFSK